MTKGKKTKIVLDADVVIHFSKGEMLSLLPGIFPDYEFVLLKTVYEELNPLSEVRTQVDNQILFLKNITLLPFTPHGEMLREYAKLKTRFGNGESACMAYCLFNHDVIGSSNVRDIRAYCEEHQITYLTTLDFLWYGWRKGLISTARAQDFISKVRAKGSKLPEEDIEQYVCRSII